MLGVVEVFYFQAVQKELSLHLLVGTAEKLVEDMVVALVGVDSHYSRLFQEIPVDIRSCDLAGARKLDPNEFTEPGRIVIPHRLGVAKRFEDGICAQDLL
jgi:hypothetical protein